MTDLSNTVDRLYFPVNFQFQSHRRRYMVNHLRFDGVFVVPSASGEILRCIRSYEILMAGMANIDPPSDPKTLRSIIEAFSVVMCGGIRYRVADHLFFPNGGTSVHRKFVSRHLDVWCEKVLSRMTEKVKALQDDLFDLEAIAPFEQYNGSVAKFVWNALRNWRGAPAGCFPLEQMAVYWNEVKKRSMDIKFRHKIF